ncbi:energy-coupling factor ABC transporter permease [Roseateles flavus]|uniref:Energy-coupling factor ABC transporter permease n=1 Tax=Roseateles flavus TaxID=3149041 RepID=A0ABV0GFF4_9BURK
MHIEPGLLAPAKLLFANGAAALLLAHHAPALLRQPVLVLRSVLAALFFTACMQLVHLKVGPSELHFVGAMPIYLLCGLVPTLFGFGLGLLVQGLLFEPLDLVHLAVNALSLMVPLLLTHQLLGRRDRPLSRRFLLQLDATYYAGVTLMVGFWLANGQTSTALQDWAMFAASYVTVALAEPLLSGLLVRGAQALARRRDALVRLCCDERISAGA